MLDRPTVWSECMWDRKKSRAAPARRRLQKSTAMGVWGIRTPFMVVRLESPVGCFQGLGFCVWIPQQRRDHAGAKTRLEALKESQLSRGIRYQIEQREGSVRALGCPAARPHRAEGAHTAPLPPARGSGGQAGSQSARCWEETGPSSRSPIARRSFNRAAQQRPEVRGWGKGTLRSKPGLSRTVALRVAAAPRGLSARGRDFRRKREWAYR